jgi:hypothetical protein
VVILQYTIPMHIYNYTMIFHLSCTFLLQRSRLITFLNDFFVCMLTLTGWVTRASDSSCATRSPVGTRRYWASRTARPRQQFPSSPHAWQKKKLEVLETSPCCTYSDAILLLGLSRLLLVSSVWLRQGIDDSFQEMARRGREAAEGVHSWEEEEDKTSRWALYALNELCLPLE